MEKIINRIKQMNLFQKIQVLSAILPSYSCLFVIVATYLICWKKKASFGRYIICSVSYFAFLWLAANFIRASFAAYMIRFLISLIGNYSLVCIQMKKT